MGESYREWKILTLLEIIFVKILLFGSRGQLGYAIAQVLNNSHELYLSFRTDCDLTITSQIESAIDLVKPDLIINAAAYTNVDSAENNFDEAFAINAKAPEVMAKKACILNIPLIHFSSDYVFDGLKTDPYIETDPINPQSSYAKTKAMGEEAIRLNIKHHLIIRTSWLYGNNTQNFVYKTIHQVLQNKTFNVVNDEWGSPTSVSFLAQSVRKIIPSLRDELFGTYHLTNSGNTSRFGFASFIKEGLAQLSKMKTFKKSHIQAISSLDYQSIAKRPSRAILDSSKIKNTFMLEFTPWEDELMHFLRLSFKQI